MKACASTSMNVCLCHGLPPVQQWRTCSVHPSLTFVISLIIFHPQIYVQHNQCSSARPDSESPSVCVPQPFPFMHLLFICTSLTRVPESYLPSPTHDHRREAKVRVKCLWVCGCLSFQ